MADQVDKLRDYPRRDLPRHLFRAFSTDRQRGSRGCNSPVKFVSHARCVVGPGGALPPLNHGNFDDFAVNAAAHMRNLRDDPQFDSPLISFSSSILVALVVAEKMRKHRIRDIFIAIFDIRTIESPDPIFPAARLRSILNKRPENRRDRLKAQADEFLAYDCIQVKSSFAGYVGLVEAGLLTQFLPELCRVELAQFWPKPARDFRNELFAHPPATRFRDMPVLRRICLRFEGRVDVLSLKVHLLSLRKNDITLHEAVSEALRSIAGVQLRDFLTIRFQYHFQRRTGSHLFIKYGAEGHRHEGNLEELEAYTELVNAMCIELFRLEERTLFEKTGQGVKENLLGDNHRAMTNPWRITRNVAFEPGVTDQLKELGVLQYVETLNDTLLGWQNETPSGLLNPKTTEDIKLHLLQTKLWADKTMQLVKQSSRRGSSDSSASMASTDGSIASCTTITTRTTTTTITETTVEESVVCTTPGPPLPSANPTNFAPTVMTEPTKRKARPDDEDERLRAEKAKKIKVEL